MKMPALLTSATMDLKRDNAVSTILAAVAGSPMWPSTRATWLEAVTSVDWVTFRELATTLNPRVTNAFTIPAPIPCEAPVTMAVFRGPFMVVYLENVLLLETMRVGSVDRRLLPPTQRVPLWIRRWGEILQPSDEYALRAVLPYTVLSHTWRPAKRELLHRLRYQGSPHLESVLCQHQQ